MRRSSICLEGGIQLIEMEAAVDRRTVLRHVSAARFGIVSPALANFGGKRSFERAFIASGAEDDAGAGVGGARDFRPELRHLGMWRPVLRIEQHIAVKSFAR